MSYTAQPQNSPLATVRRVSRSASPNFQLSSSQSQVRFAGNANARTHASHATTTHRPAHHRQVLPPGIEEQPF